ncbi:MAG: AEC family transporter [Infirmifilum sp.]
MFQELLNIYIPLLIGITLGFIVKPSDEQLVLLAKIVLYIFLPALLFSATYARLLQSSDPTVLTISLLSGLSVVLTFMLTKALREKEEIILTSMYANAGYLPLGIAQSLYGESGAASVGFYILGNNSTSNFIAPSLSRKSQEKPSRTLKRIMSFPPIVAIVLGSILGLVGIKIPDFILSSLKPFAESASSLALVELGIEFSLNPSLSLDGIKAYLYRILVVVPLTFLFISSGLLKGVDKGVALIESVMPSAVSCMPISRELGLDSNKVSRIIFTSTLIATMVVLPIVLFFFNVP